MKRVNSWFKSAVALVALAFTTGLSAQVQVAANDATFAVISGETTAYYDSQTSAMNAWVESDGNTLKLLKDATMSTFDIDVDYNLTLDLNGKTLNTGNYEQGIRLNKGNLTVKGDGSMGNTRTYATCEVFNTAAGTTLTIEDGDFYINENRNMLVVSGNFVFKSGKVGALSMFSAPNGTTATIGGTVLGQFTLPSETGVSVTINGGSVFLLTSQGSTYSNNTVTMTAGSVQYFQNGGINNISGGSVEYCPWGTTTITGGTFSFDPTKYVASDCKVTKTDDVWVVVSPVAQIGETKYYTLAEAVAAANLVTDGSAQTITLLADCETSDTYQEKNMLVLSAANVTLDLNEKTLTTLGNYSFTIGGDNDKVINGTVKSGPNAAKKTGINSYAIVIASKDAGTKVMGVVFENVTTIGGVAAGCDPGDKLTCAGGCQLTLRNCDVTSGDFHGVIEQGGGDVIIESGKYRNVTGSGTAVCVCGGTFTLKGGIYSSIGTGVVAAEDYEIVNNTDPDTSATYPKTVSLKGVAKVTVGDTTTYYSTLADAVAAANLVTDGSAQTITLLADCETSDTYQEKNMLVLSAANVTLDLNEKTLTTLGNYSFTIGGDNDKVINGTVKSGPNTAKKTGINSYAIVIASKDAGTKVMGVVFENVTAIGGVAAGCDPGDKLTCAGGCQLTLRNCDVTSGDFHCVIEQGGGDVIIESGSYNGCGPYSTAVCKSTGTFTLKGGIYSSIGTGVVAAEDYEIVNNTDEETKATYPKTVSLKGVAKIGTTYYQTLAAALSAAQSGETITLLANLADTGVISLPANVTLDGNGKTISGNSCVYINTTVGGTVKNTVFENISNGNSLSAIYATGAFSGTATITGCTFNTCDWDAIQVTPVAGANIVITDNTFNTADANQQRYVHVESAKNVDFSATVTNNIMKGNLIQGAVEVYWFADTSKVDLTKNYIEDKAGICILEANGTNVGEKIYPCYTALTAEGKIDTTSLASPVAMIKTKYNATAYMTIADAVAAVEDNTPTTIMMLTDVNYGAAQNGFTIPSGKTITLDLNGVTITNEPAQAAQSILVEVNGNLTIDDSSEGKTGTLATNPLYPSASQSYGNYCVDVCGGGSFTLNNGTLVDYGSVGGACYAINVGVNTPGYVTINGGLAWAPYSTAVRLCDFGLSSPMSLTMTGGEIRSGEYYYGAMFFGYKEAAKAGANIDIRGNGKITGGTIGFYVYQSTGNVNLNLSENAEISCLGEYGAIYHGSGLLTGGKTPDTITISGGSAYCADNANAYSVIWYDSKSAGGTLTVTGGKFCGWFYAASTVDTSVSGGIYDLYSAYYLYPGSSYFKSGYALGVNGDEETCEDYPYGVDTALASIDAGSKTYYYGLLQWAIDDVSTNETVCVLKDNDEDITVTQDYTFSINSNGHELTGTVTVPADWKFVKNGDVCTYQKKVYVAQIVTDTTTNKFETVQAAVNAAADGDTVTMIANVACDDSATLCTIAKGKNVILDLNGKTIASTGSYAKAFDLFQVFGTLVLADSSEGQTGAVSLTSSVSLSWDYAVNLIWVGNGGALVVNGGTYTITTPSYGYAEYVICASNNNGDSDLIINGGTFVGNKVDALIRLHDQEKRTGTHLNVTINGGTFTLNGGQCDSVVWLDVQTSGTNDSDCDLTVNGGVFTSNSTSPVFDIGHVGEATGFDVAIKGGSFKGQGQVIKMRELSDAAIAKTVLSGGFYSTNTYVIVRNKTTQGYASMNGLCIENSTITETGNADYPYGVGEVVWTGEETTAVVLIEKQTNTVDVTALPQTMPQEVADKIEQNTYVTGVKLATTNEEILVSGAQSVVAAAKESGTAAFASNLEKGTNVIIQVDVEVKPTLYVQPAAETKDGTIAFNLTPMATVTIDEGGDNKTNVVEVTNEMIDQLQDIVVTVYTGFKPVQAVHTSTNGTVIQSFAADEITYDEATGNASVIIHHFSNLSFKQAEQAAKIGDVYYVTLAAAFAAAEDDDTIELLKNAVLDAPIAVTNEVTLDIGEFNVTATNDLAVTGTSKDALFVVKYGADFTVEGTTGTIGAPEVSSIYAAIKLTEKDDTFDGTNRAKLTVDANVTGYYYAIVGNGGRPGTDITVNGGTITAVADKDNLAIFNPQANSTVTINGGTLTGYASAVEMRGGTLVVNGGTLTATAEEYSCSPSGSGNTTKGAAIAVAQHTTKGDISVTVNGGTITGVKAFNEADPQGNEPENVTIAIKGGSFDGAVAAVDATKYISGGSFSQEVTQDQCKDWYAPTYDPSTGTWGVKTQTVFITNVAAAQRYPWNGLVDVTFTLKAQNDVTLFVAAYDGDATRLPMTAAKKIVDSTETAIDVSTGFAGAATSTEVTYHIVWDSNEAAPGTKVEDVTFKVLAK